MFRFVLKKIFSICHTVDENAFLCFTLLDLSIKIYRFMLDALSNSINY